MVRFAEHGDFPELMDIWQRQFKDSPEGTELIFSKLQRPENMLVMVPDNKITAMLSIMDFTLTSPTENRPAAYIYGVASAPDENGKGYATTLLDEAHKLLSNRGDVCSALVPAGEKLFAFYEKRGYKTAFNIKRVFVGLEDIQAAAIPEFKPVTPERFAILRDSHFSDSRMFVRFPEEYLSYIIEESVFYGGGAFEFTAGERPCLAVVYRYGDEITVKELAAGHAHTDEAIAMIKAKFPAQRYVFRLREDAVTSYSNNLLPFGMLKWYDSNANAVENPPHGAAAYIAHALD